MSENVKEEVKKLVNEDEAATPPAEPQDAVQTVKTESPKVTETVDAAKLQEQINNLNKALAEERDLKKQDKEKISKLEEALSGSKETLDKLKGVFSPEPEDTQSTDSYLTPEKLTEILDQREEQKKQSEFEKQRADLIQNEISDLEKEFDGNNGKPKYDDREVLQWQKDNNKLYLTPKEAFSIMKQKEIMDYSVKSALSGKSPVYNVEEPAGAPGIHEPTENVPNNEMERKKMIMEALENADKDI